MSAYDDLPSDTEPTNVIPLRPRLRLVKVFGSDLRDALANQETNDLNAELARLDFRSADAGSYDPLKTDDDPEGDAA